MGDEGGRRLRGKGFGGYIARLVSEWSVDVW